MSMIRRTILTALATVPAAMVFAPSAALAVPLSVHPDAELLAAEAEYRRLWAMVEGWPRDEDVPDDVVTAYVRQAEVVAKLPASTVEGVAAKLRTFTREIEGCAYEGTFPEYIRTALEGAERASRFGALEVAA